MNRIVVSLILAVGLFLPSVMAVRPPAVHASVFCDVVGEGFPGCGVLHGVPETICEPHDIVAHGSAKSHGFTFSLTCSAGEEFGPFSVSFNADTLMTSERVTVDGQKSSQIWVCNADPWIAGNYCYQAITHAGGPPSPDYAHPEYPFSAEYLDGSGNQAFAAALQAALKQNPAPVPPPQPVDTKVGGASCVACAVHAAPSLPDLAVTAIRPVSGGQVPAGSTPLYEVVVANTGAKLAGSGQVQVQFQATGSVWYYAMAQTPAGFTCSGAAPVICVGPIGGYGDPPITTSVVFRVQVQAGKTGLGSLSAAADPNNLFQESDENNNNRTLPITVN